MSQCRHAQSCKEMFRNQRQGLVRVLALCVQFILLDETVIVIRHHPGQRACAVIAPLRSRKALRGLLCHRVACVDPIGVDVHGGGQVVDICLEGLAANFALKVADAGLFLDRNGDGLLVVAEEALEGGRKLLLL